MSVQHLLLLLALLPAVNSLHTQCLYRKLPSGNDITEISGSSYYNVLATECSLRCTLDTDCNAYYLTKVDPDVCWLVYGNQTIEEDPMFIIGNYSVVFMKDMCEENHKEDKEEEGCSPPNTWTPPGGWNGSLPVVYRSFDSLHGLQEMEGTEPNEYGALVAGKVNNALRVNHTLRQWVDLGNLSAACITIPDTCGPEGAAMGFWLRVTYCRGLFASRGHTTGFMIFCSAGMTVISFRLFLAKGSFIAWFTVIKEWTHVLVNYIGPSDGEGIRIYYNGTPVTTDTAQSAQNSSAGNGNVVFGRYITVSNANYGSAEIDELVFFNRKLTEPEIESLYNKDL